MAKDARTLRLAVCLLLCVGVAGLLGCKQEAGSAPARPIPEVGVMTVAAQTIPDDPEFIGQAEASRIVEIRSQVTGIIKQFFFRWGLHLRRSHCLYLPVGRFLYFRQSRVKCVCTV